MHHHVVLYRLREGVTIDRVRAARESLSALVETLPGVVHLAVTDNLASQNQGFTLALFSVFETKAAFDIFLRHPERLRVEHDLLGPVVAERLIAEGASG